MNVGRAAALVTDLAAAGVRDVCVCPGGRNAPLVLVLSRAAGITVHTFYEERAAAFFALGRARATGRPVAVVTTSGTAAAELLPAAVEAYYAGVPLLLVTADRPPSHRGTGSPQAIEQLGLYGTYAPTIHDGWDDARLALEEWNRRQPAHVNVCFGEPLLDGDVPALSLSPAAAALSAVPPPDTAPLDAFLAASHRPLVIVGTLTAADRDPVAAFLTGLGAPVYAEPTSGLREHAPLAPLLLRSGEQGVAAIGCDGVLRIGGVPTLRVWRDLDLGTPDVPVCSVSALPFPGMTRGTLVVGAPGSTLSAVTGEARADAAWCRDLLARDAARDARIAGLWRSEPAAEPALIRALSERIPRGSLVYLGNSLPIREWDLAALREPRDWEVVASRGANGIDGQIATFLGHCGTDREHWALIGDLTALYDLGAPWILPQLETGPVRIVILNNRGGQIFARLSPHAELRNEHAYGFAHWAAMWNLPHVRWDGRVGADALPDRCVIELVPDADATTRAWAAYDAID